MCRCGRLSGYFARNHTSAALRFQPQPSARVVDLVYGLFADVSGPALEWTSEMRILITAFTFAPQVNGVAEVVGVHAEHLVRRGHEVCVVGPADLAARCAHHGLPFEAMPSGGFLPSARDVLEV